MTRAAIFDAVKAARGRGFTPDEVPILDVVLDRLGVPKDGAKPQRNLSEVEAFWKGVRGVTGPLKQAQVETVGALLAKAAHWPVSWLAYGLATAWHEARMEPIEEWGKGKGRPYAKPGKYGQSQHGRGLVQLTWDANYERADKECGLGGKLLKDFALALQPDIAVAILVRGMEEGWFTGKKLADYLPGACGAIREFENARRIINGVDRAELIAAHALRFQDALSAGGWA